MQSDHQMARMGQSVRPVPRFEIVQTDAEQPWLARMIGANGEQVWRTSENYVERQGAAHAIRLLIEALREDLTGQVAESDTFLSPIVAMDVDERAEVKP
jgi:uncharacterized protein YegP (UPF0339 family)